MNTPGTDITSETSAVNVVAVAPPALCANCGAPLQGAYCAACGQPAKGLIRPLSSMLSDVADTIFNIDSRIFRTLFPLYFRPGFLSNEYFAGRRVRFVTPFRLYFFLSVAAFLLMQASLDSLNLSKAIIFDDSGDSRISAAQTPPEVIAERDKALAGIAMTKSTSSFVPSAALDEHAADIRKQADQRLTQLKAEGKGDGAAAPQPPAAASPAKDMDLVKIDGAIWDPRAHPTQISWLPQFANARLSLLAIHVHDNLPRIRKDPKPFLLGAFSALPQVLFILMPLFALLLKIFYIFKRRLYMEHLIVALYSHSFIFLSLLLITLVALLRGWASASMPWLAPALSWLIFAMGWWLPIHLFLMQKKVYKQGWFFTSIKFCMIGLSYLFLILLGVAAAFAISLATT